MIITISFIIMMMLLESVYNLFKIVRSGIN